MGLIFYHYPHITLSPDEMDPRAGFQLKKKIYSFDFLIDTSNIDVWKIFYLSNQ